MGIPSVLKGGMYHHRSLTIIGNLPTGCSLTVAETLHSTTNETYIVIMSCKPGPDLFIADWQSRKKHKDQDTEIPVMMISIDVAHMTIDIPECMTIQGIQRATLQDNHLQELKD